MRLSGFDGCNQINGILEGNEKYMSSKLIITRMACRESIHNYVSKRFHETVREGFSISKETKHGVKGITLKSNKHELFFKRMGA